MRPELAWGQREGSRVGGVRRGQKEMPFRAVGWLGRWVVHRPLRQNCLQARGVRDRDKDLLEGIGCILFPGGLRATLQTSLGLLLLR